MHTCVWCMHGVLIIIEYTAWCSEIGSLTSLDACNSGAFCDVREPISLHQAVHIQCMVYFQIWCGSCVKMWKKLKDETNHSNRKT